MAKVEIFGKTWDALLDTGSEISIMPVAVYNEVKREEGTNALPALDYSLLRTSDRKEGQGTERRVREQCQYTRDEAPALRAEGSRTDESRDRKDKVVVCKRAYVAPGECKWVEIQGGGEPGEKILESTSNWLRSGLCTVDRDGVAVVPVWNVAAEPLVLKVGQEVGTWEHDKAQFAKVTAEQIPTDMLVFGRKGLKPAERREMLDKYLRGNRDHSEENAPELWDVVEEFNTVFAVEDRELSQTNLVVHEVD
ncbi:unnamed protein product [Heligmosomoides polygyrus]|uniref:Peptidase A2 domain-containing protein n=1 Tax=Heligmosomoides polygyrus TaxID=6339 RepID=A0A183GP85_HELPZ|nr:unnamed protein product [Heligmosomoides polygyrus]